jgi:hypothetical protein
VSRLLSVDLLSVNLPSTTSTGLTSLLSKSSPNLSCAGSAALSMLFPLLGLVHPHQKKLDTLTFSRPLKLVVIVSPSYANLSRATRVTMKLLPKRVKRLGQRPLFSEGQHQIIWTILRGLSTMVSMLSNHCLRIPD